MGMVDAMTLQLRYVLYDASTCIKTLLFGYEQTSNHIKAGTSVI